MIIIIWTKYIHPHQERIHELSDKLEKTSKELSSVQVNLYYFTSRCLYWIECDMTLFL